MSKTVSEFMKKPVKKYACDRNAKDAKKTLLKAFTASKKGDAVKESILFEDIIDSVMKTKKGRETMTTLSELGYSFAFEEGNFGGFCDTGKKKIVINPNFSIARMIQAAVHEGTHAIQASYDCPNEDTMQAASYLRFSRAIEADAVAHEMAFTYECRDVLPAVYKSAQKMGLPMFTAYVDEMEKSGDEKKAMQASFAAWYECDSYREYYDDFHKESILDSCKDGIKKKQKNLYSKEYPAEEVLKSCRYNGEIYMTPEFLNKGQAFSITAGDKKTMNAALKRYADAVGAKVDTSLSTMSERTADGKLLPEKKAVNAAVIAKAKQKGR